MAYKAIIQPQITWFPTILYSLYTLNYSYTKVKQTIPFKHHVISASFVPFHVWEWVPFQPTFTLSPVYLVINPYSPNLSSVMTFLSPLRQEHLVLHFLNLLFCSVSASMSLFQAGSRAGNLDLFICYVLGTQ